MSMENVERTLKMLCSIAVVMAMEEDMNSSQTPYTTRSTEH